MFSDKAYLVKFKSIFLEYILICVLTTTQGDKEKEFLTSKQKENVIDCMSPPKFIC